MILFSVESRNSHSHWYAVLDAVSPSFPTLGAANGIQEPSRLVPPTYSELSLYGGLRFVPQHESNPSVLNPGGDEAQSFVRVHPISQGQPVLPGEDSEPRIGDRFIGGAEHALQGGRWNQGAAVGAESEGISAVALRRPGVQGLLPGPRRGSREVWRRSSSP